MNFEKDVLEKVHKKILALRNIENLITSREFQQVFSQSGDQKRASELIDSADLDRVRDWYKTERLKYLGTLGIRELRIVGAGLGVKNYNFLSKALLLSEIVRLRDAGTKTGSSNSDPGTPPRNEGSHDPVGSVGTNSSGPELLSGGGNGRAVNGTAHPST